MTAISYVAVDRGLLASGHSAGSTYNLETEPHDLTPTRKTVGDQVVAEDGTTEGTVDRIERGRTVLTDYIEAADVPLWEEFIDSVAAAEPFSLDETGTIAAPVNPVTVVMVGEPKWSRHNALLYQLQFNIKFA